MCTVTSFFVFLITATILFQAQDIPKAASAGGKNGEKLTRRRRDPECGPRSLWVAAGRLGISLDLGELEDVCHMTGAGTTMLDLKDGAIVCGLQAEGGRLTWDELVELDAPAVLFVSSDHFCCVDPREKLQGGGGSRLRIYDLPGATLWLTRSELESIWRGEALVIRSPRSRTRTDGPVAQFETTFADFGVAKADAVVTNEFSLKNTGHEALRILELRPFCGCAGLNSAGKEIPPGETGKIVMKFSLQGRQGAQLIQGSVRTNDPARPLTLLTYRGVVERPVLVTPHLFDFGEMIPGQEGTREVIVTDRGDQTLQWVRGSLVTLEAYLGDASSDGSVPPAGKPTFELRYVPCGVSVQDAYRTASSSARPSPELNVQGYPLRYRMVLKCTVGEDTPYGKYFGTLQLKAQRQGGQESQIFIPVALIVAKDLYATPRLVCFGVMRPGENRSRTIRVQRRSGKSVELVSCRTAGEMPETNTMAGRIVPQFEILMEGGVSAVVEVTLKAPRKTATTTGALSGHIELSVTQESPLRVEWLAVIGPEKQELGEKEG